jgi:DNA-binding LacI/PurR family transcriptional regulator
MPVTQKNIGAIKPTINDVAALAGVSKKTVSRVINEYAGLTDVMRAKVKVAIAELGRLAAQKLLPEFLPDIDIKTLPVTLESTLIERDSVASIA